ncbi:MAG: hypothetical protein VXZ61_02200 [Pseudomonadota bacterium]|nr:hypothetical protein [Pseudomonadota bacterium]|tara:strand:- start:426 stop:1742 length:1317 start_codon:yes stop_codon:yes gene_type:complete
MKKLLILLIVPYSFVAAEVFEEEFPDGDLQEEYSLDGQACFDYIDNKGWSEGENTRKGKSFYVGVGIGSSGASMQQVSYIDSIQNAFIRAQMNAKTDMAESQAKQITSEISNEFVQSFKEGVKPVDIITNNDLEAQNYDDLSVYQKMKLLIHQKLNESISKENKDKVGENERELQREIDGILSQNVFRDSIEATAASNIRGMKVVYSNLSAKPNSNKTNVCNVVVWSENFVKYADAMTTGNFSVLNNPKKKKKPLKEQVKKGDALMVTFGTFMDRDENGDMAILSYAQSGIKSNTSNSQQAAIRTAKLKAERAIIQFRSENVEVQEKINNFEITTEKANGMIDTYTEENIDRRQRASASGTLQGSTVIHRWVKKHPVTSRAVAGVVVAWSPSAANFAKSMKETLEKQPNSSGSSSTYQIIEPEEYDSGSSGGDDEDDF